MPQVQRSNVPPAVFQHLLDRVEERAVSVDDLEQLAAWLDKNPTVPVDDWFKRFESITVCERGVLIRTFLTAKQTAKGTEVH